MTPREAVVALLAVGSVAFTGLAAVGLLRLPEVYSRAHAASKADTLGALSAFAAVGVAFGVDSATLKTIFLFVFVLATTPAATHAVVRTAYRAESERGARPVESADSAGDDRGERDD
ncbi:monovalent cation/H(+) antiporter subunit G [Halorussus caseinilyticus]|uniref:Monovalent cation/H(+) antiporter subunit G n=1 Tax=Halorussus caseinilyticus TaxID=3034025 RepID=A0ABD5WRS4_9EURY|nr:monovalent cation/H(+) antiporter subunit G [Halorussus sp. DT72]